MSTPSTPSGRDPIFPLPFSREQLRKDVTHIILNEWRRANHIIGSVQFPNLSNADGDFWSAGSAPAEIGITYDMVKSYPLAEALEDYFDFGFFAVTGTRSEPLLWDNIHTWIGAYLVEQANSPYADEWGNGEGHTGLIEGIKRCLYLCELANARVILEGGDHFYHFAGASKENEEVGPGFTIRDLAMLAGMEEMSLRSAISRKTSPILEICKDDRRTYIKIDVAKEWLIAKGRYQTVIKGRRSAELDLATTRFDSANELKAMLEDRLSFIGDKSPDKNAFESSMREALLPRGIESLHSLSYDDLCDSEFIEGIGQLLALPTSLLKIRAKEATLKSRIAECEWQLIQLQRA